SCCRDARRRWRYCWSVHLLSLVDHRAVGIGRRSSRCRLSPGACWSSSRLIGRATPNSPCATSPNSPSTRSACALARGPALGTFAGALELRYVDRRAWLEHDLRRSRAAWAPTAGGAGDHALRPARTSSPSWLADERRGRALRARKSDRALGSTSAFGFRLDG